VVPCTQCLLFDELTPECCTSIKEAPIEVMIVSHKEPVEVARKNLLVKYIKKLNVKRGVIQSMGWTEICVRQV
jgi:hypothetical protein